MKRENRLLLLITLIVILLVILYFNRETVMEILEDYEIDENLNLVEKEKTPGVNAPSYEVEIKADACNLSGDRVPNARVAIGYNSDYKYYAYTNDLGQVVYVEADEIKLQDDSDAKHDGRYCRDEAKVKGVEKSNLDEGHVIADSLGGVSNSYNITPQDSYQNRNGCMRTIESEIRDSLRANKKVTDYYSIINYKNKTQTPSSYEYGYRIDGKLHVYKFDNNPNSSCK